MIQCALESGVVGVGGWSTWKEKKGGGGGWVERCPTVGGTDEVREKWREKKGQEELRKGTLKWIHFLFQTQGRRKEKTLTPGSQEHGVHKKQESEKARIFSRAKRVELETRSEKKTTLVYSWMCVSLLRNADSQSDHNDITLLSPATFCFDFLSLFIVC